MEKCQASQGSEGLRWRADGDAFPGGVTDSCAGRVPRGQSCEAARGSPVATQGKGSRQAQGHTRGPEGCHSGQNGGRRRKSRSKVPWAAGRERALDPPNGTRAHPT